LFLAVNLARFSVEEKKKEKRRNGTRSSTEKEAGLLAPISVSTKLQRNNTDRVGAGFD